ncbi:MAG: 4-(cytidine 5'-diphospho)-2-C-methyl-D-erythritol kinase [Bdellovibrionota bacterium]
MKIISPAKLNLILRVGPLEDSGFHQIASLMTTLAWGDEMEFFFSPKSETKIEIECDRQDLNHEKNLAVRAAHLFSEEFNVSFQLKIKLKKQIPSEAGLGGGSSNAASVLKFLKGHAGRAIEDQKLNSLAAKLGSDVPFFLGSASAWCTGRGEILEACKIPYFEVLLVFPKTGISTSWAYKKLDERRNQQSISFDSKRPKWSENPHDILDLLENDFESLALENFDELERLRIDLENSGALKAQMTGSGSCFFGLYESKESADRALSYISQRAWRCQRSFIGER